MVIRELCGQLYAMAAQYLYIKGEGVRFYAPPYTVEVSYHVYISFYKYYSLPHFTKKNINLPDDSKYCKYCM